MTILFNTSSTSSAENRKKNGKKMWLKIIELINVKNLIRWILLGKTFLGLRSTYTKQRKLQLSLIHLRKDLIVYEVNLRWLVFCLGMDGRWCHRMLYRLGWGHNLLQQVWLLPTALLQAHLFTWLSRMRISAQSCESKRENWTFAWLRHLTTSTRILWLVPCKLKLLLFLPHWEKEKQTWMW